MASPPDLTARIDGRVDLALLANQLVAVVGVGTVGSQVANELANAGVARQLLIDYDLLKPENIPRHVLGKRYELMNKAEAMVAYFKDELGQTAHRAAPLLIRDDLVSDGELTELFTNVDLVVAATGDPRTQRRLASLALRTWGVPALFPAITGPFDGEVFVQLDRDFPCFHCWHAFRDENAGADAVTALNIDAALGIAGLTTSLALGLLNESADTDLLMPGPQDFQPQLFIQTRRAFAAKRVRRRHNCPSCGGRQDVIVDPVWTEPFSTLPGLDDEEPWQERSFGVRTVPTGTITPEPRTPPPPQQEPTPSSPLYHAVSSTPLTPALKGQRWWDKSDTLVIAVLLAVVAFVVVGAATSRQVPADIEEPAKVKVDYHQSLAQMITATHLPPNVNHVPITEKRFPVTRGPVEVEVVSIRLSNFKANGPQATGMPVPATEQAAQDQRAKYLEVQHDLSQLGYRPATLREMLAYVRTQGPPAGLVLTGPVYHGEYVTCGVVGSELQCSSVAEGFDQAAEFLAVKK